MPVMLVFIRGQCVWTNFTCLTRMHYNESRWCARSIVSMIGEGLLRYANDEGRGICCINREMYKTPLVHDTQFLEAYAGALAGNVCVNGRHVGHCITNKGIARLYSRGVGRGNGCAN